MVLSQFWIAPSTSSFGELAMYSLSTSKACEGNLLLGGSNPHRHRRSSYLTSRGGTGAARGQRIALHPIEQPVRNRRAATRTDLKVASLAPINRGAYPVCRGRVVGRDYDSSGVGQPLYLREARHSSIGFE